MCACGSHSSCSVEVNETMWLSVLSGGEKLSGSLKASGMKVLDVREVPGVVCLKAQVQKDYVMSKVWSSTSLPALSMQRW